MLRRSFGTITAFAILFALFVFMVPGCGDDGEIVNVVPESRYEIVFGLWLFEEGVVSVVAGVFRLNSGTSRADSCTVEVNGEEIPRLAGSDADSSYYQLVLPGFVPDATYSFVATLDQKSANAVLSAPSSLATLQITEPPGGFEFSPGDTISVAWDYVGPSYTETEVGLVAGDCPSNNFENRVLLDGDARSHTIPSAVTQQVQLCDGGVYVEVIARDAGAVEGNLASSNSTWYVVLAGETSQLVKKVDPVPELTLVTTGGGDPTASPDGQWIAYTDLNGDLKKISVDGGTPTDLGVSGYDAAWHPDGDVIAYNLGSAIYTVPAGGGSGTSLYNDVSCGDPSWHPTGDEFVVKDHSDELRIIAYPSGQMTGMIACQDPVDGACENEGPTWSGQGDWIAFEDGVEIMRIQPQGGTAETVVGGLNDVSYPAYSPDGNWVAFTMDNDGHDTGNNIWVADARGHTYGLYQVTIGATVKFRPCWSPDSRIIYFEDRGIYDPDTGYEHEREVWKIGFTTD